MNYLTATLIAETFPETARIFYGLSKSEFASEPDLAFLAIQNGLLVAAAALGQVYQVHSYLSNPRLCTKDIHAAFEAAYKNKRPYSLALLLLDPRLDPKRCKGFVGKASPILAIVLMKKIVPRSKDVIYAALGSHGGFRDQHGNIHFNNLTTLKIILMCPNLKLSAQFCETMCEVVEGVLRDSNWEEEGVQGEIEPRFFEENFVTYTNFRELGKIFLADSRFAPFAGGMRELLM